MDDDKDLTLEEGAEDQEGNEGVTDQKAESKDDSKAKDKKSEAKYTDADMDAAIEKRLARERAKMEREIHKQIEEEAATKQTEAEKLKSMTELQRAQYEAKQILEENKQLKRQRDLSDQTDIARKELDAADIHLGDDLLPLFVSEDADLTGKAIDKLKELWPKAVNEAVQKELKRNSPLADKTPGQKSFGAEFAEKYSNSKTKNGGKE